MWGGFIATKNDRNYYRERLDNFKKQIPNLQDIKFIVSDVYNLPIANNKVLYYLDPPYSGTSKYDYGKNFNHEKFWDKVRELSKESIVIVSEQKAPDDFVSLWTMETTRRIINVTTPATENLFIWRNIV